MIVYQESYSLEQAVRCHTQQHNYQIFCTEYM